MENNKPKYEDAWSIFAFMAGLALIIYAITH